MGRVRRFDEFLCWIQTDAPVVRFVLHLLRAEADAMRLFGRKVRQRGKTARQQQTLQTERLFVPKSKKKKKERQESLYRCKTGAKSAKIAKKGPDTRKEIKMDFDFFFHLLFRHTTDLSELHLACVGPKKKKKGVAEKGTKLKEGTARREGRKK